MNSINFFSLDSKVPPGHEKMPTDDGTFTFQSSLFQENCHSTSGAYEETVFNYIEGTQLKNKLHLPEINIFEVGFGLGYGPLSTFYHLRNYKGQINFYSTELDENLLAWFRTSTNNFANKIFPFYQLEKKNESKSFYVKNENRTLEIFTGDIIQNQQMIFERLQNIHAIFQDPFSPKKNPTLWTKDWFIQLKKISHETVILSTYSASQSVHDNLTNAGWIIYKAPGFSHKRSSTRATIQSGIYTGPIK